MKRKPKKPPLPRRAWQINPVTRVKGSAKVYRRAKVRREPINGGE